MKPLTALELKVTIALMLGFTVKESAWACGLTYKGAYKVRWRGLAKLRSGAKILDL